MVDYIDRQLLGPLARFGRFYREGLAAFAATHPAAGMPVSLLMLMQSAAGAQAEFRARGLDSGMALYLAGSGRSVVYR